MVFVVLYAGLSICVKNPLNVCKMCFVFFNLDVFFTDILFLFPADFTLNTPMLVISMLFLITYLL